MGSDSNLPSRSRRMLQELAGMGLPALLAAGLFILLPADSRSQGDSPPGRRTLEAAPVCGEWHRGSGPTSPLDTGAISRAYLDLKKRVTQSLDREIAPSVPDLSRPYDAGLPACRGEATRIEALPVAPGSRFRGRTLYFVSASAPGRLELPPEIEQSRDAEILVVKAWSLKDLPEIARSLGRPVSLGTAEFAKALGVRCAGTWLKISEKGDAVELHESR